jgi:hypothetical protein
MLVFRGRRAGFMRLALTLGVSVSRQRVRMKSASQPDLLAVV